MRYLFGFLSVCALGVVPLLGCETAETGDMPECETATDCADSNECTGNTCADGVCESMSVADGTACGNDAGTCQEGSCQVACTEQGIRDAIAAGGGPFTFGCENINPGLITAEAEIVIDNDVILDGEGELTVYGKEEHRVFSVEDVTAELRGITVSGGWREGNAKDPIGGGGIDNRGTLTLTNSTVRRNAAGYGCGGGIVNQGTLTLTNSTVSENTCSLGGGGICNLGTLTLTNSAVFENRGDQGGGILSGLFAEATLTITNSTVSGNSASVGSDLSNGIDPRTGTTATITNSTVSGQISNAGTLTVANSVFVGGCGGELIASGGYNIESPGNTCGFDRDGTDQVGVAADDLNLGELADNGGPTMTHALLPGSVAIDVIPAADCGATSDQRGEPRDSMCDVGAFEVQAGKL